MCVMGSEAVLCCALHSLPPVFTRRSLLLLRLYAPEFVAAPASVSDSLVYCPASTLNLFQAFLALVISISIVLSFFSPSRTPTSHPSLPDSLLLLLQVSAASATAANVDVAVVVPFPFLVPVKDVLKGSKVFLGAQDLYTEDKGAYTGATSLPMIKSVGAQWVLCGHSERRALFGDTDETVNAKLHKVLSAGLKVRRRRGMEGWREGGKERGRHSHRTLFSI